MFKAKQPHFVTGEYRRQSTYLDDAEYGRALDCLVKTCTDLLICDSDGADCNVLLGKRIVDPQPDWWYMGGRMKTGETPEESIARLIKREQSLSVDPSRFRVLGYHSYHWARRQQPPSENGTCDLSVVFTLTLQPGEAEQIHMDEKEYSELRWFRLRNILESNQDFHPALVQSVRDIYARHSWDQLRAAVKFGESLQNVYEAAVRLSLSLNTSFSNTSLNEWDFATAAHCKSERSRKVTSPTTHSNVNRLRKRRMEMASHSCEWAVTSRCSMLSTSNFPPNVPIVEVR